MLLIHDDTTLPQAPPGLTPEERLRSTDQLAELFKAIQDVLLPEVIVEIGAYDARFARAMKLRHSSSRVVAFEGNPENHAYFAANCNFNKKRVEYVHALVTDVDGSAELLMQSSINGQPAPAYRGNDSILARTAANYEYRRAEVPAVRLDTFFAGETGDFALWIDVEGAFERVFAGGPEVFRGTRSLQVEVEEHAFWRGQWLADDVHAALRELGFVAVARDFEADRQFNVVYVRRAEMADIQGLLADQG